MENILSRRNRPILEQFAWSNVLLAFDYDGTLAPIVADPAAAGMRTATRGLLARLARLYPCVVISGRARADAARHVAGLGVLAVIGNHGLESNRAGERARHETRGWRRRLEAALASLRGVMIEDKGLSLSVHYRRSREKRKARAAILRAVGRLGPVRLVPGKQVFNLLPEGAPHKGVALERERARFGCDTAVYVGDDDTDEDVFALDDPGRLLSVRVGASRRSAAPFFLRGQREIDALLRAFLVCGEARSRARPRGGERVSA